MWETRARNWRRPCSSTPMISLGPASCVAAARSVPEESIRPDLRQLDALRRLDASLPHAGRERLEGGQGRQRVGAVNLFVRDDVNEAHTIAEPECGIA